MHLSTGIRPRRVRRWIFALVAVIAIVTLIPLVVGGWAVWRTGTAVARAVPELTRVAPPSSLSTAQARTTADLKQLPGGYHALSASPPAGGYGAVDPVAALSWALSIAQAWESDARLERIDVSRLRPDGTVNVQDDGDALLTFRFRSPSGQARCDSRRACKPAPMKRRASGYA